MQTSLMLTNVTQLTKESERSKSPPSVGRGTVVHLPATFLTVIRRKVIARAVTICISHPFGRCSCVTVFAPLIPFLFLLGELRSPRIETSGWKGRSTIRPRNISRFREEEEENSKFKKTGHSESASSRRHRVAPLLQLREEPHRREGEEKKQRPRSLQLTSGSSPRFVMLSFFVSCVIDH